MPYLSAKLALNIRNISMTSDVFIIQIHYLCSFSYKYTTNYLNSYFLQYAFYLLHNTSTYEVLRILSVSLLDKTPITDLQYMATKE